MPNRSLHIHDLYTTTTVLFLYIHLFSPDLSISTIYSIQQSSLYTNCSSLSLFFLLTVAAASVNRASVHPTRADSCAAATAIVPDCSVVVDPDYDVDDPDRQADVEMVACLCCHRCLHNDARNRWCLRHHQHQLHRCHLPYPLVVPWWVKCSDL